MNIFKNKYFLLGNLAFLLLVIPLALFLLKNQTKTRGSAAPTTTLSFNPATLTTDQCTMTSQVNIILNPGQNIVSTVFLTLKWDKSKFDITFSPSSSFPQILKGPDQLSDGLHIDLNIGADITKAIVSAATLGTITIKPVSPTTGNGIPLSIDPVATKVYSQNDGTTENVYNAVGANPLLVKIDPKVCQGASPTPTVALSPTISPTLAVTPTTAIANIAPTCLSLSSSVSSGSAPLSVTLTGLGNDTDGTISQATFNFGDGTVQNVSSGLGLASASAQLAHTYTVGGAYSSTVTFTDNSGAISNACTQQINISGTPAPTVVAGGGIPPTEIPTATPTIAPSGSISSTLGLIGGIMVAIAAGIFLLAL